MMWWQWMILGGMVAYTPALLVLAVLLWRANEKPGREKRHEC